jgi:hypothetical protein
MGDSDENNPFPKHRLEFLSQNPTSCKNIKDLCLDQTTRTNVKE